jgi:hypothetical protein
LLFFSEVGPYSVEHIFANLQQHQITSKHMHKKLENYNLYWKIRSPQILHYAMINQTFFSKCPPQEHKGHSLLYMILLEIEITNI